MGGINTELPLVGRERELAVMAAAIDDATAGSGSVVIVQGEAGIGKTRLVQESTAMARAAGHQVITAKATELDHARPFALFAGAIDLRSSDDPLKQRVRRFLYGEEAQHLSGFQMLEAAQAPLRVTQALLDFFEAQAASQPLLIALEDLHWGDLSSVIATRELGLLAGQLRMTLLVTARPVPRSRELEVTLEDLTTAGATSLQLKPLADDDVARLVIALAGAPPGATLKQQLEGAQGNPLYTLELLRAFQREGMLRVANDETEVRLVGFPPGLRMTLLHRLRDLPEETLNVLKTAAVFGTTFDLDKLSVVLDLNPTELLPLIDHAARAGFIEERDDRLAFRHDLMRDLIYEDLPQSVRKAVHLQIATSLKEYGANRLTIAEHYALGASPGNREAIAWLREAGKDAAAHAPAVAVEIFRRVLSLMSPGDPQRDDTAAELATALLWAGHLEEGENAVRDLLSRPVDPATHARVQLALAYALILKDRITDSLPHIESVARRTDLPPFEQAQLLAEVAFGRLLAAQLPEADEAATAAVEAGRRTDNDAAVSLGLATSSWRAYTEGRIAQAVSLGEEAVAVAERSVVIDARRQHPHVFLGMVYLGADRFDDAEAIFAKGLAMGEELGTVWDLPIYHCGLALRRFYNGDWNNALTEAEAGIEFALQSGTRPGIGFLYALLTQILVRRGQSERAAAVLDTMDREIGPSSARFGTDQIMWARALHLEASGSPEAALATLEAAWDLHSAFKVNTQYRMGPHLVRLALRYGKPDRVEEVTRTVATVAEISRTPSARGTALRCQALLDDEPETALAAVDAYRDGPRAVELAGAKEDSAQILWRAGLQQEARTLLAEAIETYESIGASWDAGRALSIERSLGIRRGRRGQRRRADTGWESLTETEQQITDLVADGLTNREVAERLFISPRTVQTHVAHIFGKLGLSSRVELGVEAARRLTSRTQA